MDVNEELFVAAILEANISPFRLHCERSTDFG